MRFAVEVKRNLRPHGTGHLVYLAEQLAGEKRPLLVCADRVAPPIAETLREKGIAYVDLGGNAYLRGPGLFLWVDGRKAPAGPAPARHLTGAETRLLGVFLRDIDAGEAVQKDLAARAGVALGLVGRGRQKLADLGLLARTGKRRWQLVDREEGLRRFAEGWAGPVRRRLEPQRFRVLDVEGAGDFVHRIERRKRDGECLLGGELAAARLTEDLRTDHVTLHIPRGVRRTLAKELALAPDESGTVTLLDRYGTGDAYRAEATAIPLAHPLLVWAECLTVADERVARAAAEVYERYLKGVDG